MTQTRSLSPASSAPGGGHAAPASVAREGRQLAVVLEPDVDALAVMREVDLLLDRHPTARLPGAVLRSLEHSLSRVGRQPLATSTLARLIVCAQRDEWNARLLRLLDERPSAAAGDLWSTTELVRLAAELAPATESPAVLVLLAALRLRGGDREEAVVLTHRAIGADPHDLGARALLALLCCAEPLAGCPRVA